jgi:hypothetical protein
VRHEFHHHFGFGDFGEEVGNDNAIFKAFFEVWILSLRITILQRLGPTLFARDGNGIDAFLNGFLPLFF